MEMEARELREYITVNGRSPFGTWIKSLKDINTRARIRVRLNRLRLGNFGDCRSVGGGVQELRIDFGPGYRIYFGQDGHILVILLCGGTKKSQRKDVEIVKQYWQDYKRRKQ